MVHGDFSPDLPLKSNHVRIWLQRFPNASEWYWCRLSVYIYILGLWQGWCKTAYSFAVSHRIIGAVRWWEWSKILVLPQKNRVWLRLVYTGYCVPAILEKDPTPWACSVVLLNNYSLTWSVDGNKWYKIRFKTFLAKTFKKEFLKVSLKHIPSFPWPSSVIFIRVQSHTNIYTKRNQTKYLKVKNPAHDTSKAN